MRGHSRTRARSTTHAADDSGDDMTMRTHSRPHDASDAALAASARGSQPAHKRAAWFLRCAAAPSTSSWTRTHLPLASLILLATVLASKPVYAYAPPATDAPSVSKPSPKSGPAPTPVRPKGATTTADPASGPSSPPVSAAPKSAAPAPAARAAAGASAGPKAAAKSGPKGPAKPPKGGKKAISIEDEFLIEGKLEKPNAYYILRRSSVDFDWARLGATFSPLVLESVQDPLF